MFIKKVAACLTGLIVLALTLPVLAGAQAPEKAAETTVPAAQEPAEEPAEKPDQSEPSGETSAPDATERPAPAETPVAGSAAPEWLALLLNGRDVTGGDVSLSWPESVESAPTALIRAVGPDGKGVLPAFSSSDPSVAAVDASGLVTAAGLGTATVTATLDAHTASIQVSVGRKTERVVIIAEDTISPGHSIKLRAFDQDGNRISVLWRSSPEKLVEITSEGVLTVRRGAAGQTVEITALAEDGSKVSAITTIRIE